MPSHTLYVLCASRCTCHHVLVTVSQEPRPLTEDIIVEQQLVYARLGSDKEASQIRQKLQTDQLRSDMSAFKVRARALYCQGTPT